MLNRRFRPTFSPSPLVAVFLLLLMGAVCFSCKSEDSVAAERLQGTWVSDTEGTLADMRKHGYLQAFETYVSISDAEWATLSSEEKEALGATLTKKLLVDRVLRLEPLTVRYEGDRYVAREGRSGFICHYRYTIKKKSGNVLEIWIMNDLEPGVLSQSALARGFHSGMPFWIELHDDHYWLYSDEVPRDGRTGYVYRERFVRTAPSVAFNPVLERLQGEWVAEGSGDTQWPMRMWKTATEEKIVASEDGYRITGGFGEAPLPDEVSPEPDKILIRCEGRNVTILQNGKRRDCMLTVLDAEPGRAWVEITELYPRVFPDKPVLIARGEINWQESEEFWLVKDNVVGSGYTEKRFIRRQ